MSDPISLWVRQDLHLADNPTAAALADRPVLPVLMPDDAAAGRRAPPLLARGRAEVASPALARATGAGVTLGRDRPRPVAAA